MANSSSELVQIAIPLRGVADKPICIPQTAKVANVGFRGGKADSRIDDCGAEATYFLQGQT